MKAARYDHLKIEKKWQKEWEAKNLHKASDTSNKKKFYPLVEFPFPSGAGLHTGHIRSYTAMDIVARKRRMMGQNVLYPMGWDAFGLPTENYAIKTGKQPKLVTKENTDNFRKQLKAMGFSFDWSREVNTTDPGYYKWTQWIFLQMYEKGLAYKAKMAINWCPKDKIGLANEEVVNGCCERCGTAVEKRDKEQWMLAITKYADRLDKDLDDVDYLDKIKIQQRNWIGRSEGAEIEFKIQDTEDKIKIFTTRADTLFGVTYVVLAPEHELVKKLQFQIKNWSEIEKYISDIKKKTEIERTDIAKAKTGVVLKGVVAINPANGEEVSIWIADYVLASYGTGAVMAVPAHDERDFEFAQNFKLPIKTVVEPFFTLSEGNDAVRTDKPFVERRAVVCIIKHWEKDEYLLSFYKKNGWKGFVVGGIEGDETLEDAGIREIREETGFKNIRHVRDLGAMRSRFYHEVKEVNRDAHFEVAYFELANGEREEMSAEEKALHDVVWMPRADIAKTVNRLDIAQAWKFFAEGVQFDGDGILVNSQGFDGLLSSEARKKITEKFGTKKVTYKLKDWVFSRQRYWGEPIPVIHCLSCGVVPVPEKDLPIELPAVKQYEPTDNGESPLAAVTKWVNVKCPKCKGKAERETDTMPNWAGSSWYYLRYVDPKNKKSFADKKKLAKWVPVDWYNGGMEHTTLHLLYSRFWHKFLYDLKLVKTSEPYMKRTSHGMILAEGGEKMSKSKGNVVNPDDIVKMYGADSLRIYEMFMGPFDQAVSWNTDSIMGARRFVEKVWRLQQKVVKKSKTKNIDLEKQLHKTIKKVTEDIETMSFNTAISSMMILVNEMDKAEEISVVDFSMFIQLLAPFAPHVAEDIWKSIGNKKSVHLSDWPKFDKKKIIDDTFTLVVQVNGKVRAQIAVSMDATEDDIKNLTLSDTNVKNWTEGKEIKKFIYVRGKLVSIVI